MKTSELKSKKHLSLLRKFHAIAGKMENTEQVKESIKQSYNVHSSRDLNEQQLIDICNKLEEMQHTEGDKWRKRLIASISAWLTAMSREHNINVIKAVACRASKRTSFNSIPVEQLRSLYYAFNNKAKDIQAVDIVTAEDLEFLKISN
jgi:hypothetical protein